MKIFSVQFLFTPPIMFAPTHAPTEETNYSMVATVDEDDGGGDQFFVTRSLASRLDNRATLLQRILSFHVTTKSPIDYIDLRWSSKFFRRALLVIVGEPLHCRHFNVLVPLLVQRTGHGDAGIRKRSLDCLVNIIPLGCAAIDEHMQTLLNALSARTSDDDPTVRVAVCQALTEIVEQHLVNIVPMLGPIFQFFLHATQNDPNEDVALQACTFWQMFCDNCGDAKDELKMVRLSLCIYKSLFFVLFADCVFF